ncbi:RBBP9/YdeN family alpha/beta hydrolase [Streptomyces sp. NPDC057137]|uniref:RBBP9/YdeN family alpha/beta hydrolase n=1 Tax=Streptomyces sp. NPDC057137 TaxID=3346030 RepID=UPI00364322FF
MTSTSFLILHGWLNHRPAGHWQHWLADELAARGNHVIYPQLPEPDDPDLAAWLGALDTHLATQRAADVGERVVICHSLAVLLWLHAVARGGVRVDRILLVGPPSAETLARYDAVAGFGRPGATAAQLRAAAGTTRLAAGDDDPYCEGGAAERYGRPLGLDSDVITGGAHLDLDAGYGSWPSVLDWCLDPAVRLSPRPRAPGE